MPQERGGERAVVAQAVEGDGAGVGGEAHQHAAGRLDRRKARGEHGAGLGRAKRLAELIFEWIVPTGVEQHDLDVGAALHLGGDGADIPGLGRNVGLGGDTCIDGHDIVPAVNLESVPGVEEQRQVDAVRTAAKVGDKGAHPGLVHVDFQIDLEIERSKDLGQRCRVVRGVSERRDVQVTAISDQQGHTSGLLSTPGGKGAKEYGDSHGRHEPQSLDPFATIGRPSHVVAPLSPRSEYAGKTKAC